MTNNRRHIEDVNHQRLDDMMRQSVPQTEPQPSRGPRQETHSGRPDSRGRQQLNEG